MTTPEARPGGRRSRSAEAVETLLDIAAQAQDGARLEDRKRAEENEGGGVHLPTDRAELTAAQRHALEAALVSFRASADHEPAAAGDAEVERLGRKWLAAGRLTRDETARLEQSLQNLRAMIGEHIRLEDAVPHVVIVGSGFGGLYAARDLADAPVHVTIIDRHNYHLFRPMLYQVATGLLSSEEVAAPIRSVLRGQKNVDVLLGEVTGVDVAGKRVLMGHESLPYDYLILATGIHYNYFGHDDWQQVAPSLSTAEDAAHIRGRILNAFEVAERLAADAGSNADELAGWLTFALVGGGPTGVEMAGSIAELARTSLAGDFRHIDPKRARILLFEAGPRILSAFPEGLAGKARRRLEQLGVTVHTGARVEAVAPDGVTVDGRKIPCRTVIWAAGVTASSAGKWLGAAVDRSGRVKVGTDLSVPGHPDVFVIGDTAAVVAPWRNLLGVLMGSPKMLPGVAQPAMQEGGYVASLIRRRLRGLPAPERFSYRDKGDMAIVGQGFAVADLKVAQLWGLLAWLLWLGVHIFYLVGFANRLLVTTKWAFAFFVNHREARVFTPEAGEMPTLREPAQAEMPPSKTDHNMKAIGLPE